MNFAALKKLRQKLAADQPVYGIWITLESPSISEMAVALGLDWLVIDAEHGHLDWKEILEHIRAAVRSDTVVLIRLSELNIGLVKRALDIGADGIVIPWVENASQLRQALSFALYPPEGLRGIGGERATGWGQCFLDHTQQANAQVLVVPIIETVTSGRNIRQLSAIDGIELFFIGPADYSSTAGYRGQWEAPGVAEELLAIKEAIREAGKQCGIMATSPEDAVHRQQQGFRAIALGSDAGLFLRGLRGSLEAVGLHRRIVPSFVPEDSDSAPAKEK
jgi:2-keto-3-deoxy-L-rhamnonate aldolase RhmA